MLTSGVHISTGNSKVGKTPSVSLTPVDSCPNDIECYDVCYARDIATRWKHVAEQWEENWLHWKRDQDSYFSAIERFIKDKEPEYFRWHIGGDIPEESYLFRMIRLAQLYPTVNFLAFSKAYDIVGTFATSIPVNLSIYLSVWPYKLIPDLRLPRAWVRGDLRIPLGPLHRCKGSCDDCRYCWHDRRDILLKGH